MRQITSFWIIFIHFPSLTMNSLKLHPKSLIVYHPNTLEVSTHVIRKYRHTQNHSSKILQEKGVKYTECTAFNKQNRRRKQWKFRSRNLALNGHLYLSCTSLQCVMLIVFARNGLLNWQYEMRYNNFNMKQSHIVPDDYI